MAKRTYLEKAYHIIDRVDKSRNDATFKNFVVECLKLTLQEIIAQVPYAGWLQDEDSVTTTSGVQYVAVPTDCDPDNILTIRDETNNFKSIRINPMDADLIDPGRDLTGDEFLWWIQTVGGADRIYFLNRPDSVDTLKLIFGNVVTDPAEGATSALPAKYESIEIDGALVKVWERIDPNHDTSQIQNRFIGGFNQAGEPSGMCRIVNDAKRRLVGSSELAGHRPMTGSRTFGPSWPADFDIRP